MSLPEKDIAILGRLIGGHKISKRKAPAAYVPLPIESAEAIHTYLKLLKQRAYSKAYHKL